MITKSIIYLLLLVYTCTIVIVAQEEVCGSIQCAEDELCCDNMGVSECYAESSYFCLGSGVGASLLCAIENGVPTLQCGSACFSATSYTCCNGTLYNREDASNPCRPVSEIITVAPDWEAQIDFISGGFSSPGGTDCSWNAATFRFLDIYELYNCTTFTDYGSFNFNETSYTLSFTLPASPISYSNYSLNIHVDNSNGENQQLIVSVFSDLLSDSFNVTSSTLFTYPCDYFTIFAIPLYFANISVEAGFVGYKSVDITSLLIWSLANNSSSNFQLSLSSFSSCSCVEFEDPISSDCTPTNCSCFSTTYHLFVNGIATPYPPHLILSV